MTAANGVGTLAVIDMESPVYLIDCPNCQNDVLVSEEQLDRSVRCDWCRQTLVVSRLPDEATVEELADHLRHRGRSHATTLIGMAAANLLAIVSCWPVLDQVPKVIQRGDSILILVVGCLVLVHIMAAGVMIAAAYYFRRARQHGMCLFATVLMMLPGCSVLFLIGILAGWPVLRFLLRPEVKLAFVLNSPDGDPDAV